MRVSPLYRIRWAGSSSFDEVRRTLMHYGRAEIQLPPDYHHALYRRFHPGGGAEAELLQVSDGADLVHQILSLRGLEDLSEVEELARQTGAHVELVSPVPLITLHIETDPD